MGILKDYDKGNMDKYRSLQFSDYGTGPIIEKKVGFQYNQANSRLTDLERFTKLLTSAPGLKFQGNQALLQQVDTGKKLQKAATGGFKSLAKAVGKQLLKTATNNVAKTASILAQVPVNGTGTHFLLNISPDTYLEGGTEPTTGLGRFLRDQGIGGGVNGAKSALAGEKIGTPILDTGGVKAGTVLFGNEKETLLSRQQTLGASKSAQEFADLANFKVPNISSLAQPKVNPIQLGASKLPPIGKKLLGKNLNTQVPDIGSPHTEYLGKEIVTAAATGKDKSSPFGKIVNVKVARDRKEMETLFLEKGTETTTVDPDTAPFEDTKDSIRYRTILDSKTYTESPLNIQTKYKLGDQGNRNSTYGGVDQLNLLAEQTANILDSDIEDIIPFQFEVVEPNMGSPRFLYFRAFLDDLNDNFTGEWSGTKYIGRAEQFYTYQGFNRELAFSFKIAAFSKDELLPLYKKLNFLVGTTAPTYASNGEFMKGTLTAITIGDYITNQEGFISSVNLSWDKSYQWETNTQVGDKLPMLPHVLNVSVNFTPIHKFNVKSNIDAGNELYIGGLTKLRAKAEPASAITPAPIEPLPTATLTANSISPVAETKPTQMSPEPRRFFANIYARGGTVPPSFVPPAGLIKGAGYTKANIEAINSIK